MFKKGKHWTKSKNVNSKRYKNDLANYLDGRSLKCVTEKIEGIEEVVAKKGSIIRKEDELIVYASQDVLLVTIGEKIPYFYTAELGSCISVRI